MIKDITNLSSIQELCKNNPINCIIIILIIIYTSFVNNINVPRFLNNPVIRMICLLIIIYAFMQNELIGTLLGFMIILSISLNNNKETFPTQCAEKDLSDSYGLNLYKSTLYPPKTRTPINSYDIPSEISNDNSNNIVDHKFSFDKKFNI